MIEYVILEFELKFSIRAESHSFPLFFYCSSFPDHQEFQNRLGEARTFASLFWFGFAKTSGVFGQFTIIKRDHWCNPPRANESDFKFFRETKRERMPSSSQNKSKRRPLAKQIEQISSQNKWNNYQNYCL
jgi:hypothetical protein